MISKRWLTSVTLALFPFGVSGLAAERLDQQPTIPELVAAETSGPLRLGRTREVPVASVDQMSRVADLVVLASLRFERSYLSESQYEIVSDYEVLPVRVVLDRLAGSAVSRTPRMGPKLMLRLLGGEMDVNGVRVTYTDRDVSPVMPGDSMLLFLKRDRVSDKEHRYVPVGSIAGLLKVENGRIQSMIRHGRKHEETGKTLEEVLAALGQAPR